MVLFAVRRPANRALNNPECISFSLKVCTCSITLAWIWLLFHNISSPNFHGLVARWARIASNHASFVVWIFELDHSICAGKEATHNTRLVQYSWLNKVIDKYSTISKVRITLPGSHFAWCCDINTSSIPWPNFQSDQTFWFIPCVFRCAHVIYLSFPLKLLQNLSVFSYLAEYN